MSAVLSIDTASNRFALALAFDGEIVSSLEHPAEQEHSQQLLAQIDELLAGRRRDLRGIVVVRGPGSYAGLRVGIATAQGLALALGVPLVGVGTLEAVAYVAGGEVSAIHPAGRGEFAVQPYRNGSPTGDLVAARPEELQGNETAGEGAAALGGREVTPEERARAAAELGSPRLEQATGEVDALYLREPNITRPRSKPAQAG